MPDPPDRQPVIVHLIDGTYELFRHFYGSMRGRRPKDPQFAAVRGVLGTVLGMIEGDATHIGVATDHVIESFRNDLWPGYKTGAGVDPALKAQFEPLEQALAAMGVAVWPMVELEADDAMASAVHLPDYLALAGDSADGYPGIKGIGAVTSAGLIRSHGAIEQFPDNVLGDRRELALLFKTIATLRTDAPLFDDVDELRWDGPTGAFGSLPAGIVDDALAGRVAALISRGG